MVRGCLEYLTLLGEGGRAQIATDFSSFQGGRLLENYDFKVQEFECKLLQSDIRISVYLFLENEAQRAF